ncbi:Actin-related protein 2/3 complex subunit 1A [Capsicum annuum]|nr:Actin-related protein 2/3 complex subunit 1A [Capsicum annuum]
MAASSVHKFAQCITCHAWSPDLSRGCGFKPWKQPPAEMHVIALCPNNSEVHIYKLSEDKWEKVHVLQKHDQIVSGIDWSYRSNKIVTVSHDRNSYVWNQETTGWVPTLVILRLNRAALCVQWSPKENKFAVGSGAKTVCICYYEQENNWWVSKLIRKRHDSSVTSIAWHPNNVLLATTSTDGKCRVFSTFIKGVDAKDSAMGSSADTKFGEPLKLHDSTLLSMCNVSYGDTVPVFWHQIVQLDLCFCWAFGVRWSPSGNTLAYVGHNSMIYFVDEVGPSAAAQSVAIRDLPLRDILFLSERMVVGVGFDCNPMVFVADDSGLWSFLRFLDERKAVSSSAKYGSQFSEAFGKFYGQSKLSASNNVEQSRGAHDNCINCILPLAKQRKSSVTRFSTSGLDGKIVTWDLQNQEDLLDYL